MTTEVKKATVVCKTSHDAKTADSCAICATSTHKTDEHVLHPKNASFQHVEALFQLSASAPLACVEHFVVTGQLCLVTLLSGQGPWSKALLEIINESELDLRAKQKKRRHYSTWSYHFPCRLAEFMRSNFAALVDEAERTGNNLVLGHFFHLASLCELTKTILDFGRQRLKQSLRPRFAILAHVARHCVDRFRQKHYSLDFLCSCMSFALNRRAKLLLRPESRRKGAEVKQDTGDAKGAVDSKSEFKAPTPPLSTSSELIEQCAASLSWLILGFLRPSLAFTGDVYEPIVLLLNEIDEARQVTERLLEESDRRDRRTNDFKLSTNDCMYSLHEYGKIACQLTWALGSTEEKNRHPTAGQVILWDKLLYRINYDRDHISAEGQVPFGFGDVVHVIDLLQTDGVSSKHATRLCRELVDEFSGSFVLKNMLVMCFRGTNAKTCDDKQACLETQYEILPEDMKNRHDMRKRHLAGLCACKCCCPRHYLDRCPEMVRLRRFNWDHTPDSPEDQAAEADAASSSDDDGDASDASDASE